MSKMLVGGFGAGVISGVAGFYRSDIFTYRTRKEKPMADHIQNKGQIGPVTTSSAAGTGIAGAAGVLIVYLLSLFGLEVPNEVAAAIVVLIGAIGSIIGGKVVSPEKAARFQIERDKPAAEPRHGQ